MKHLGKSALLFLLAFLISVGMGIYQRRTGPTYPKKVTIVENGIKMSGRIARAGITGVDTKIPLKVSELDTSKRYFLVYRRYKFDKELIHQPMKLINDSLIGYLPNQPPAGKLEYAFVARDASGTEHFLLKEAIVIRYKGAVPRAILVFHVIMIFTFMIFSNFTAIATFVNRGKVPETGLLLTLILLILGGLVAGPIVQKFAFGDYWTGFPFGYDLTDNKILIAFIFWIWAFIQYKRKQQVNWIYVAAIVTFIIFVIPHSVMGSELNYETMEVIQSGV